jgi:hypothetical protein
MGIEHNLTLTEKDQHCLAFSYLRLMRIDIAASQSKDRVSKMKDHDSFVKVLGSAIRAEISSYSSALGGEFGGVLAKSCSEVSGAVQAAMILSEIAVYEPWTGKRIVSNLRICEEARRIVLKEIACHLRIPESDKKMDSILDDVVPKKRSFKTIALITLATAAGGLIAAPHIGAAIGVYALGLHGAAATSAGLAALGFGATATGGFGMAGGTIIVGALTGAAGGAASIATSTSALKSTAAIEALKLCISLEIMLDTPAASATAERIVSRLKQQIGTLRAALKAQQSLEQRDKKKIKELESEIDLLKSCLPDRVVL